MPKRVQPHGGALNAGGTPGNAGGGRPRKVWKEFLEELRRDPEVQDELLAAAKDRTSAGFRTAIALAEKYDPDKPAEKAELKISALEGLIAGSWSKADA